jgi:hypothetical protein
MNTDIQKTLKQLAKIKLDDGLILSLYLDLRTDPKGQRHYQTFLKKKFSELEKNFPPRSPLHNYLMTDIKEINRYLKEELDGRSKGLALFISQSKRFFSAIQTALPFENRAIVSRLPYIYPLVRMADDHAPYGIILSDEKRARLIRVNLGQAEEETEILSDVEAVSSKGYETKKGRLGHSDERYQRHLKEQVAKHARLVLAKAAKLFAPGTVDAVVLMAENGAMAELQGSMPAALKPMILVGGRMDMRAPRDKILAKAAAFCSQAENEKSLQLAKQAVVLGTGKGVGAALGTEAALNALQSGQAEVLVISEDYRGQGWKCRKCLQLGSGGLAAKCPYCQEPGVSGDIDMKEEMVEAAIRRGARVEFYSGKSELDRYQGVGALLR